MGNNLAINKTFPDFRIDLLEIPGQSYAEAEPRYTFRLDEQENLWEYYFVIIERLRRQIKNIPYRLDAYGVGIEDSPEFNAIREALVNLLMHSDYFSPTKPRIRVFTNRMEFENPGAYPRPINVLLKKDVSIPRNPVITKLFRLVKLADNAGFGFDKMLKWEQMTNTKVLFENSIDTALVTFALNSPEIEHMGVSESPSHPWNVPVNVPANVPVNVPANDPVKNAKKREKTLKVKPQFNKNVPANVLANVPVNVLANVPVKIQRKRFPLILELVRNHNKISKHEMAKRLSVNEKTIQRDINKLKELGLITRMGSDKSGYWQINALE